MKKFLITWAVASVLTLIAGVLVAVIFDEPDAVLWVPAGGIPTVGLWLLLTQRSGGAR